MTEWISHEYIHCTQAAAIHEANKCKQRGSIVLHLDFAENWIVLLSNEIQLYHWYKKQIPIFTCVATTRKPTHSFAVVSDDMHHDTAHAATSLVECTKCWMKRHPSPVTSPTSVMVQQEILKISTNCTSCAVPSSTRSRGGYFSLSGMGKTPVTVWVD